MITAAGAGISLAADLFIDVFVQAPTSISNSGTIVAPTGISLSRVPGDVTIADSGKILATNHAILIENGSSISSIQIYGSTLTGGISNAGAIATGISLNTVSTFMGGIVNSGSISGGINLTTVQTFSDGISNSNDLDHIGLNAVTNFSGNISNSGAIAGAATGIAISGSTIAGAIVDNGRFLGGSSHGIAIDSTSQIDETAGNAISITGASFSGGLSSVGLISAAAGSGIYVSGVTTFAGGITNAGTISALTAINIVHSTITGAIVDSGNILGSSHGIVIDSASTITSATNALHIFGPTFIGGISNAGTISAAADGIAIANVSTFSATVSNAGVINGKTGSRDGICVSNTSFSRNTSNAGMVNPSTGLLSPTGIQIKNSTINGVIANSGTIFGGISIDGTSRVAPSTGAGVAVTGGTFAGGISSADHGHLWRLGRAMRYEQFSALGTCDMAQVTQLQGKNLLFSRVAVGRPEKGQPVKLVVQVPVNVSFATQVHIQTGDTDPGVIAPFANCTPNGCFAEFDLREDPLKKLREASGTGKLSFADAGGHDVTVPISLNCFSQAFDALAKK